MTPVCRGSFARSSAEIVTGAALLMRRTTCPEAFQHTKKRQNKSSRIALLSRMICPLDVTPKLCRIEIDLAQIARCITLRLIVEVRRRRIATLAARADGFRA